MTTKFLTQMIGQGDPRMTAVGRLFLLDPVAVMRDAAIAGFGLLVKSAHVDAALLSDLLLIRNWTPNGKALDNLIEQALQREPSGGAVPQPWRLHRVITSLPDGTGSQSILGVCSRGNTRAVASAMIKEGQSGLRVPSTRPGLAARLLLLELELLRSELDHRPGLAARLLLLEPGQSAHRDRGCPGLAARLLLLEHRRQHFRRPHCPGLAARLLLLELCVAVQVVSPRPGLAARLLLLEHTQTPDLDNLSPGLAARLLLLEPIGRLNRDLLCPGLAARLLLLEPTFPLPAWVACPGLAARLLLLELTLHNPLVCRVFSSIPRRNSVYPSAKKA